MKSELSFVVQFSSLLKNIRNFSVFFLLLESEIFFQYVLGHKRFYIYGEKI